MGVDLNSYRLIAMRMFILLLGQFVTLSAQNNQIRFEHLSVEDGLSQRFVLEVVADCQGFLWVATEDGLNRFNGYDFKIFRHDPHDPNSLGGNVLRQTLESHALDQHKLWISTVGGGLSCLDLTTETFINYLHDPQDSTSISSNSVWIIEETVFQGRRDLWVGVIGGLDRLDYTTGEFSHYQLGSMITALFQDGRGTLWAGTASHGLQRYDPESDTFTAYMNDPGNPSSLSWDNVDEIFEDSDGTLWIGTFGGGLDRMDSGAESGGIPRFTHFVHDPSDPTSISGNAVEYLYEDQLGNFWVSTANSGLDVLNRQTGKFTRYPTTDDNPHHIGSDIIFSACEDRSGVLWFGHVNGLSKWIPQKGVFRQYDESTTGGDALGHEWVTCVRPSREGEEDVVWVGTLSKGLCRYDRSSEQAVWYQHDPDDPTSLPHNSVLNIVAIDSQRLLVGTYRGLSILDVRAEQFSTYHYKPDQPNAVYDDMIFSMAQGPTGRIWIGTANTLVEFEVETTQFKHMESMRAYAVQEAQTDVENYLWAGDFRRGLLRIDLKSGEEVWYQHNPHDPESIASNLIDALLPAKLDGVDVLWVGTMNGLDRYDYSTGKFKHYTMDHGLPHNHINSIAEDTHGGLWITTKIGMSHFDPMTGEINSYWQEDGLPGDGYEFDSGYCSAWGEVFIGGTKGLVSFYPDSLIFNNEPPHVVLTDIKLAHESIPVKSANEPEAEVGFFLSKAVPYLDELTFSHDDKIISFTFAALDFRSPQKNQYAYFMEGFEDDWNYTTASQREVTYTNLDPGEYVFRVKASNNDGVWNEEGVALDVFIMPPWWGTRMAYLGYFLGIIAITIAIWSAQASRMRLRHQVELEHLAAEHYHELDEHKSRFMANISHEFRTPLTLILGPVSNLLAQFKEREIRDDLRLIQSQAKRLLELVVQLLDISKLEDKRMILKASEQNIVPLLNGLIRSFSSLAERKEVEIKFEAEHENIQLFVEREALVKIINNLLSNAFKFTQAGDKVKVSLEVKSESPLSSDGEVTIRVADSGIGIPADHLDKVFERFHQVDATETRQWGGSGIGLSLTRELVELHKGTIGVESRAGKGTVFSINLPRGKAHLAPHEIALTAYSTEDSSPPATQDQLAEHVHIQGEVTLPATQPLLLIVEDNRDVRKFIRSYLEDSYECHEAEDGQDGLKQVFELMPDLVISDIMMPRLDGLDFCRHLKTDERTSHIPVLMLTAKADMGSKVQGLKTGADAYLTKPFDATELKTRVKNLIDQRQTLRERFQREFNLIPSDLDISSMDHRFLERLVSTITNNLSESGFKVEDLSRQLFMSRQQLNRKLKGLTGRTTVEFIRLIRLKRAALLLGNNQGSITEIAYQVGFSNPSHFSRSFHQEYGKTPTQFQAEKRNGSST